MLSWKLENVSVDAGACVSGGRFGRIREWWRGRKVEGKGIYVQHETTDRT